MVKRWNLNARHPSCNNFFAGKTFAHSGNVSEFSAHCRSSTMCQPQSGGTVEQQTTVSSVNCPQWSS